MRHVLYFLALLAFAAFGISMPKAFGIAMIGAVAATLVWLVICLRHVHEDDVAELRTPDNDVGAFIGGDGGGIWHRDNGSAALGHDAPGQGSHAADSTHH
jgi:hypothetical protein